ncbi:Ger(x)C family spore germination protein [Ruminiclostridium cellulolyticum]|uniref:Germination protein, Ger(X)C family n=1 Tax=Ruminiclostridium cellulolyticum (strain ATCC 35319 / DSM 5812 / JCM 6584 / H10) TaxID=394503 RepID=B8I8X5_RUMCH|nr:Ger(x)C family spore germination protein [Ruminiclostridium cellulolyticum]ACL77307.1 germination protein, Ger(x)C family [Ruminiclostridium cellulolyticum H10]
MNKRLFCTLLMLNLVAVFSTGCWNYREINQMSIVAGAAIDKAPNGKYKVSIEIIDLKTGGTEAKVKTKKVETYGDSVVDAVRNAISFNANTLYWGHTEIIIISKDIAEEGIVQILDCFSRDAEPRLSMDILVSKEDTAEEILDSQSITTEVRTFEINKILDIEKRLGKSLKVEIYQFINALGETGISPIMPVIGLTINSEEKTSELSGTAVFKGDKLAYMFGQEDTQYFLFVNNKIHEGVLVVNNDDDNITLRIIKNKTKLKPVYNNGKLHFDIYIKTKVALSEINKSTKLENVEDIDKIQKIAEKYLKNKVESVIKAVQNEYGIDIFGFGRSVRQDFPNLWKEINPDWDNVFKNVPVNVNVEIQVKNSGLLSKKIVIGD